MSQISMIEKFWYSPGYFKWLFWPFSLVIQIIAMLKRFFYVQGIQKVNTSSVPVIVVGNITVGGTGKTPFISFLVNEFKTRNIKVGIVSRGYKSNAENYPHIITEDDTVEVVGDEAFMQYHTTKVPMAVGADRASAVDALVQTHSLDVIISDDGLQHYAMARQFEILMVDGERQFGNQLMLPFGPLREPVSRVKSVDYVVVNGGDTEADLIDLSDGISLSHMVIETSKLVHIKSDESVSLSNLKENSVSAVAGIGNPNRFFKSLSKHCSGYEQKVFVDHHEFQESDFDDLKNDIVVMTEKDAVKCRKFAKDNWYFLKINAKLTSEDFNQLFDRLDSKLFNKA
ncbi:tetraacyldisaccharide 4'-kinase [Aliikangiella coralliicola]|uniref:Tetraacyldisaccharide 4'-kinase n=1 Tax=Aliikangiella coralliicola TaxID=2592383 RepID=A0A545U8N9_9GAMM|nr:tetraacyldisaccharide 4'-kinase [Aliikangiella coralliicola]TQV85837.1 tetraacyldisaccharide 4'-kinase [Aliikangiella coralliicola]